MQLHQLKPSHPRKYPGARIGRGGKRGTFSGKGTKGQKSRAGHRIRPAERDYIQRLPKLRGHKNKPAAKPLVVNLDGLKKLEKISSDTPIKILGKGELKGPVSADFSKFKKISFSKSAAEKLGIKNQESGIKE